MTVKKCLSNLKRDQYLYLLLTPTLIWVVLFKYKPLYGLQIAFKDYNIYQGIQASPWIGLDHFITFFSSPYFMRTIENTLRMNGLYFLIGFPIPILLAIVINELGYLPFRKWVQTSIYLPHFISVVVVAGMVINLLSPSSGVVNQLLQNLGFDKVYFMVKPEYFRGIYVSMNIWQDAGFHSIVYVAAIATINPKLYEVAKIDGANKWQQIRHITLPSIMPTIMVMLILRLGHLLNLSFEKIILLYNPSTYETADVLSTYVYRAGLANAQYDLGAAVGLFEAIVAFTLVIIANRLSRQLTHNSLW